LRILGLALAAALAATGASAADFKISFQWGNIPLCRGGTVPTVPSPSFVLRGVPAGTTSIQFKMKDLNAPSFNHGGSGRLGITRDGTLPAGVFTYKSPCPPGGVHTYEWTATARVGNRVLGQAKAQRNYPE